MDIAKKIIVYTDYNKKRPRAVGSRRSQLTRKDFRFEAL